VTVPPASGSLKVKVWTERKVYRENDEVKIFIDGNKDFYGLIVYRDATGNLIQLLPNGMRPDNLFRGGRRYSVPDARDVFKLLVQPPFGKEQITVFASTAELEPVAGASMGQGPKSLRGTLETIRKQTRGVAIVPTGQTSAAHEFFESTFLLTTRAR